MFERFAQSTKAALEGARNEAERRGDRRIGSDHLLIALLQDDATAQFVGVSADAARAAADELDRSALSAIGLTVGDGTYTPATYTPATYTPAAYTPAGRGASRKSVTSITRGAKGVIEQSMAHAASVKARVVSSEHMLLALLDKKQPDPAAALLAALPVDHAALRARLTGTA
jgi:ATP-dependent Clp protease ATP-binding subunit ClpA